MNQLPCSEPHITWDQVQEYSRRAVATFQQANDVLRARLAAVEVLCDEAPAREGFAVYVLVSDLRVATRTAGTGVDA